MGGAQRERSAFQLKHPRLIRALPSVKLVREQGVFAAFHYAFEGIIYATRTQRNMRLHFVAAALVLAATLYLRLQRPYVIGIVVTVALVLAMELLNTAIESVVDLMTVAHHPLAKIAKDTAAGAVLVVAFGAVIVGYLTFYEGILAGGDRVYRAALALPANATPLLLAAARDGAGRADDRHTAARGRRGARCRGCFAPENS